MKAVVRTRLYSHLIPLLVAVGVTAVIAVSAVVDITATQVDAFANDVDSDGLVDPGDTLRYTVVIANTGDMDALDLAFDITLDNNTTLVPGSIESTPIANDDSYASLGNVGITVPGPGVLSNDTDPDGSGLAATPISAFDAASTNGGTVSVSTSDGGFTYTPPAGFEGTDTFTYTIDDGEGNNDVGTVSIQVADVIWFIDNSHGGANEGTLADPFQSVPAFNGSGDVEAGDDVYIAETGVGYTAGVNLQNNQQLVTEGASGTTLDDLLGITLPPHSNALPAIGGARPMLTSIGSGVNLASGNTIRGLNIGNTIGTGIVGSNFGTLTVADVMINGTGEVLDLNTGNLAVTLDAASTISSSAAGIDLNSVSGTFAVTASVSLQGVAAAGFEATNNSATINLGGPVTIATTGAGTGFHVEGGGTLTVLGSTNTINTSAGTGTGVNITNTTIGAGGVTFQSVNVNGGTNGIVLNNTGTSGGFTITGDGSDNALGGDNSGGTIQNTTGTAIDLDATHNFSATSILVDSPGGDGLNGLNISGSNSLKHVTITDIDAANTSAVHIKNTTTNLGDFLVERSKFTDAMSGQSMFLVEGGGGITMQVRVDSSEFSSLSPVAFQHTSGLQGGDSPTLRTFFTNNQIVNAKANGISEVNVVTSQAAASEFVIEDNVFSNVGLAPVSNGILNMGFLGVVNSPTVTGIVKGNIITNIPGKIRAISFISDPTSGQVGHIDLTIEDNNINNLVALGGATAIYVDLRGDEPTADVRVINNAIGTTDAAEIGVNFDGVFIEQDGAFANTMNLLVEDNTFSVNTAIQQLVEINADDAGARVNATVLGNVFNNSSTGDALVRSDVAGSVICLDLNSDDNASDSNSGNQDFVIDQDAGATYETEGTSGVAATIETFFNARNTINVTATGTAYTNAACPTPAVTPVITPSLVEPEDLPRTGTDASDELNPLAVLRPAVSADPSQTVHASASKASATRTAATFVSADTLGPGKQFTFTYDAAVENPLAQAATEICQQGSVSGTNFSTVQTDDTDVVGASDPTCTALDPTSLPVELSGFEAVVDARSVSLTWTTASETNNAGFHIEHLCRTCGETEIRSQVDAPVDFEDWTDIGFVDGKGSTTEPQTYSFDVEGLDPGRHAFRLKQVDFDGTFVYSETIEVVVEVPGRFILEGAYPNPFNPTANIRFAVAEAEPVVVRMFDLRGSMVRILYDGVPSAGSMHTLRIDGVGLASGTYIVSLKTKGFVASRSVVLLK